MCLQNTGGWFRTQEGHVHQEEGGKCEGIGMRKNIAGNAGSKAGIAIRPANKWSGY
jgi:hypothetical protein